MITDYMQDLSHNSLYPDLKPSQKTPYEKKHGKYITKSSDGKYVLYRSKKGKVTYYGRFDNFHDAVQQRDYYEEHGWVKPEKDPSVDYYKHIWKSGRHYNVGKGKTYSGCLKTIEEALYYRDLCIEHNWEIQKPKELDLKTDNPYLNDGLLYPVPKRLIIPPKAPKRMGTISSKGPQFYGLTKGKEYFGGYRTFEMAYYVREKMNECNWDKSQLDRIVEEYPVWYTWLMNFYQYIIPKYNGWVVNITGKHSDTGKLEHIYCHRLEDALWERDLLVKYGWDEELVIECADDRENPYYSMELPPYPQRKVRRISEREPRTDLFNRLFELISESEEDYSQVEYCEMVGTNPVTLKNILRKEYGTTWAEFKRLCESGENPNDVLEQKPIIYQPNLERRYKNTNYVSFMKGLKTPYVIYHRDKETKESVYYGAYPTRELADKISNDLQACNWDKTKLKSIQAKHGWQSVVHSKRWIEENKHKLKDGTVKVYGYYIRKKDKSKKMIPYGYYKDKRVAELVRDLLVECDWDKSQLESIQDYAYHCIGLIDDCWRCKL